MNLTDEDAELLATALAKRLIADGEAAAELQRQSLVAMNERWIGEDAYFLRGPGHERAENRDREPVRGNSPNRGTESGVVERRPATDDAAADASGAGVEHPAEPAG